MPKAPTLKRAELEKYFQLNEERLALNRRAKDLERLQEELEEKFTEYVHFHGGKERACTPCGFRLAIEIKAGRVEWKTEFLKVAGPLAAEKLIEAAPRKEVLTIEPPKTP